MDAPAPSPWITRFAPLVPAGPVLDLACGSARHGRLFLARGHAVTLVDRDLSAVADLAEAERIAADLEDGSPWPLPGRRFAGLVVTNYLHRPLFPAITASLAPGGLLLYETFSAEQPRFGRPNNPDFLLRPGELIAVAQAAGLRILAYEDRIGPDRAVQCIAAQAS